MRVWITDRFAEMGWVRFIVLSTYLCGVGFLWTVDSMELGVGLVRVSGKGSPSVPGSSIVNLMCGFMELMWLLKFVDLIFPGYTVDIINIPEPQLD